MLRCKYCGGALELDAADDSTGRNMELYQCANCDRQGGYAFGDGLPDEFWGAVEDVSEAAG